MCPFNSNRPEKSWALPCKERKKKKGSALNTALSPRTIPASRKRSGKNGSLWTAQHPMNLPCRVTLCTLAAIACAACSGDRAPAGRIMVKNDSQDREFNVISVSGGGVSSSLRPGERVTLPPSTRAFSVQRRYRDYTRSYTVECPAPGTRGIFIKLIDIHVNRIAGGCRTVTASKR